MNKQTMYLPQEAYKNLSIDDMEGEVWHLLSVSFGKDFFWISSYGRVKKNSGKKKNDTLKIVPLKINNDKYLYFTLNKRITLVHDMVAFSFIHNADSLQEKCHINGIKTDNRKDNIIWCEDNSDDILQPYILGDYKKIPVISKGVPVVKLSLNDNTRLSVYPTIKDAAIDGVRATGLSEACISGKPYKGYIWMHLRDYLKTDKTFLKQAKFITNENKHIWLK